MVDEVDYRWVKQADQEGKRYKTYRGGSRKEGEESSRRFTRVDNTREEGEIQESGKRDTDRDNAPSLQFQRELLQTHVSPKMLNQEKETFDPIEADMLQNPHENKSVMATVLETKVPKTIEMEEASFENLKDEERVEELQDTGVINDALLEEGMTLENGGKEEAEKDLRKKQIPRKRLFKPTIITGGSSKMCMVHALTSPRKRTVAKADTRKGEGQKQAEGKGASNPPPGPLNP